MQREFKSRAWDGNCIRTWEDISKTLGFHHWIFAKPKEIILMQYTGLHDKNGKEIYEGDLLLYPNGEVIRVIWMGNPASFSPKEIDLLNAPEIIGNIYENPELLKV